MPITTTSLASAIKSNILSRWPFAVTVPMTQLFDAYSTALGKSLFTSLSGAVFAAGTVTGGTAPPSGPVVGAILTYAPAAITTPALNFENVFTPPQFKIVADGTGDALVGSYTPWLKAFTKTLSKTVQESWAQFITTWSLASLACVGGGAANWVASTPPVPGPWVAGTIVTPFVFVAPGTGTSMYVWNNFDSDFVAACRVATVTIPIQASTPITTPLLTAKYMEQIARAIAGGFADTVSETISSVTVYDPSGSGGTGIAAPGGIVTGTLTGAKLNLSA